jgi:hypothetical protein
MEGRGSNACSSISEDGVERVGPEFGAAMEEGEFNEDRDADEVGPEFI